MLVAPPLLWMGSPLRFVVPGVPRALGRDRLGRLLARPVLQALAGLATRPVTCWIVFVGTTWAWHLPLLYEWALRDELVHDAEHLCFLATGLLFWWPVVRPWPARPRGPRWWSLPYLTLAMLVNTIFAAVFTFADRVIYPSYVELPSPWGIPPLTDQALAGVLMWVAGSLAMLLPSVIAVVRLLGPGPLGTHLAPPRVERAARWPGGGSV
jgi:cytochrome c oxidase assembly factor CtaG